MIFNIKDGGKLALNTIIRYYNLQHFFCWCFLTADIYILKYYQLHNLKDYEDYPDMKNSLKYK